MMGLRLPLGICLLLCHVVFIATAQEVSPDTLRSNALDEIVVSANRSEETRRTVAQQVQVIDRRKILAAQAQTTADVLSSAAGVFVQRSQMGGGSPVLRGFEASRILLMVDGVRLNNLIYRSGHLQNILSLDNNSLERIEVLYGPSSTIYGSDALGGVIHLYTRSPEFALPGDKNLKADAFVRYGSVNREKTAHVGVEAARGNWASFSSFTFSDFGDLRSGKNQNPFSNAPIGLRPFYVQRFGSRDSLVANSDQSLQVGTAYKQADLVQKIAYRSAGNTIHTLNIQFSTSSDIPRYDRLTDASASGGLRWAEWYYGPQQRSLLAYDLRQDARSGFFNSFRATVSMQSVLESRYQRAFGSNALQAREEEVGVYGLTLQWRHVGTRHLLQTGVDAQYNSLNSQARNTDILTGGSTALDTRYPDGGSSMAGVSGWISHTWRLDSTLTLTDGIRVGYSSLSAQFNDTSFFRFPFSEVNQRNPIVTGSLGLVHIPNDDLKFSVLLGTGYRVPNVDDLAKVFETQPGNVILPNSDLRPERTLSAELGITKVYNGISSWENILYYTSFFDAIAVDAFTFQGADSILYDGVYSRVLAAQNKRKAYLYGFTSSYRTRLLEDLELTASLNTIYGRFKTDSSDVPMDHIPPLQLRVGLSYVHERLDAAFTMQYNGKKDISDYYLNGEDNERYALPDGMPAWMCLDVRAGYRFTDAFRLVAGINNLFDTQYRVFASGVNAPGRNVYLSLRVSVR
ncbi:MAG: TonB-dependent receptor plug domain-containing protein [Bacteroidota bacterium]|jgi:hemoglobin/transferrin/lactoferrin receptor protein